MELMVEFFCAVTLSLSSKLLFAAVSPFSWIQQATSTKRVIEVFPLMFQDEKRTDNLD